MQTEKRTTVVGVFRDVSQARQAVEDLKRAGFTDNEIGIVSHDAHSNKEVKRTAASEGGTHVGEGAIAGLAAGAGAGGLWALGISAGLLPAIGPVIAGGVLMSILASAAGGAVAGGIVGALIGLGVPEQEARYYENEFKSGQTLVTVQTDRHVEADELLARYGGYNQHTAGTTVVEPPPPHIAAKDSLRTPHT